MDRGADLAEGDGHVLLFLFLWSPKLGARIRNPTESAPTRLPSIHTRGGARVIAIEVGGYRRGLRSVLSGRWATSAEVFTLKSGREVVLGCR